MCGKNAYSSSGISGSVSLQLNCNNKKLVTNNAPKTIKKVTIMIHIYSMKMQVVFEGCVCFKKNEGFFLKEASQGSNPNPIRCPEPHSLPFPIGFADSTP